MPWDVALIHVTTFHERKTRSVPGEIAPIRRWADGDPWFDEELSESMKRELLRAWGFPEWEPQ